ncbi:MAG: hypothetical protein C4536_09945 [Actinobacteria bacterium]|jgi:hypothetical protein|nr:MAG: hypothetical protein C4536_09945 [Actinomycetota bacterium]
MAMMRRIGVSLRSEGGFSLAEVLMAGLIMALAILPMVGMFDGAFLASQAAADINTSAECLQLYTEKIRNIPFYMEHSESDLGIPLDVDDFYWGSRSPVYTNTWTTAPEVVVKNYDVEPYPDMRVTVKMSYIDDEVMNGVTLEQAANATVLASDWQPTTLYGYDRPQNATGKTLTLILYEVKATARSGRSYTNAELYANPTDAVANVYIDRVVNIDSDSSKLGTRYNALSECVSAPHNKNDITIRAYGEGFTAAEVASGLVDVRLVRVEDTDVQLRGSPTLTFGTDATGTYVQGEIDLADDDGDEEPWAPDYRMPGYWHAWLAVDHVISVRNSAFVVEYPVPVYHSPGSDFADGDGNKSGLESSTDEVITFTNLDYVINFVTGEHPAPGVGAVVQLVHTVEDDGVPIDSINGTNLTIVPSAADGYQTGLTSVSARFNFTGHIGGDYYVRVVNCIDRSTPDPQVMGNTYFELDAGPYYYLEGPPAVDEVYVYEETPVTPSVRHFGYDDREYTYNLEIKGFNFDDEISVDDIWLGLGGDVLVEPPVGDNEVHPVSVDILDDQTIQADFDFVDDVGDTERGLYWLYVRNSNGFGNVLNPAFDIREPRPIVYDYSVDTYGLWQNYYGVEVQVIGECFDVDPVAGDYVDVMIKEKDVPANDWLATEAMAAPVAAPGGRLVTCALNLVGCDTGDWELYVKSQPAGLTDSGYTDVISGIIYTSYISVDYGTPILLTPGVPAAGQPWSVSITSRYKDCNGSGEWGEWSSWQTVTEGNGSRAWAWENDPLHDTVNYRTEGEMYFAQLRGMGFNKDGTIDVECMGKNDLPPQFPLFQQTWQDQAVHCDRASAQVWIEMDDTQKKSSGPDEGGFVKMRIRNDGTGMWSDWYIDRFAFQSQG